MPKGNEEGGPMGDRTMVDRRMGTARFLAERTGGDRKVNYRPNIRRDELCGREARGQLLLLTGFREPEQSSGNLPNARLPARLSVSTFPKGVTPSVESKP